MEKYSFVISVPNIISLMQESEATELLINYEKEDKKVVLRISGVKGREINLHQNFETLEPLGEKWTTSAGLMISVFIISENCFIKF